MPEAGQPQPAARRRPLPVRLPPADSLVVICLRETRLGLLALIDLPHPRHDPHPDNDHDALEEIVARCCQRCGPTTRIPRCSSATSSALAPVTRPSTR